MIRCPCGWEPEAGSQGELSGTVECPDCGRKIEIRSDASSLSGPIQITVGEWWEDAATAVSGAPRRSLSLVDDFSEKLGRYPVVGSLGAGGMGEVFLVRDPDGRRALSGSWDNTLRVWDLETGKEVARPDPIEGVRRLGTWTPDGNTLAEIDGNTILLRRDAGGSWRAWIDDDFREEVFRKWDRAIGIKIDMETGELVHLATPGPAYENDPLHAYRCK